MALKDSDPQRAEPLANSLTERELRAWTSAVLGVVDEFAPFQRLTVHLLDRLRSESDRRYTVLLASSRCRHDALTGHDEGNS